MKKKGTKHGPRPKPKPGASVEAARALQAAVKTGGGQRVKGLLKPKESPPAEADGEAPTQRDVERDAGAPAPKRALFPIVGIGASAGGLEALEEFLQHVPERSGMAFVVIQHQDPSHKGAMVELLQRATPMPVSYGEDGKMVEPDRVYVIPSNKDMAIMHGTLHLMPQTTPRRLNLPIDYFFRSLADDRQEASIGVVLSGMGSDGTLGLRAIKEKVGATFAQLPSSAKFDGMPKSAIDAGLADVVAPAAELPGKILAYRQHAPLYTPRPGPNDFEERNKSDLEKLFILLRAQSGNDFSLYKRSTVLRRIDRRMGLHQIEKLGDYVRYLRDNPREVELLFQELLIGVTSFFRDPEAWEHLRKDVLPEVLREHAAGGMVRVWVPACSTGEEPYSLAIILTEALDEIRAKRNLNFQIFGTDLDKEAIEKARQGVYPANIAADVSPERLRRFFAQEENGYRVRKEIREGVVFAPHNLITDPPFTKLDILSCRNFLIYLSSEVQHRLVPLFHYSLNPGGVLFLGSAETAGPFSNLFSQLDSKARIYRRLETSGPPAVDFPSPIGGRRGGGRPEDEDRGPPKHAPPASPNLQVLADRVLVQRFAPTAVLTSDKGDILYTSGRTGKYLEPAVGKANLNIFAMARDGLRLELSSAFTSALKSDRAATVRGLSVRTNGTTARVDLCVQKLADPPELRGMVIVVLTDVQAPEPAPAAARKSKGAGDDSKQLAELKQQLQHTREEAQSIRAEMQSSQEELKSANEELQSTNEELQSTNEELTTSKEEMQSMNEELQTVNHELQAKVDELARSNNDMRNLLNSTDVATLFLDGELRVRRFTTPTTKIIKLIPSDVGRPITDITTHLDYPDFSGDANEVIRTLVFRERQVAGPDGRWFSVRIMPYRTLENVIDGVVITFSDSTASRKLETTLRGEASQLQQMAESLPALVWTSRADGTCDYVSKQWIDYTGVKEADPLGYRWLEQLHPEDRERVGAEWRSALASSTPLNTEFRIRSKAGTFRWFKTRSTPIRDESRNVVKWYVTSIDVDRLKQAALDAQRASQALKAVVDWIRDPCCLLEGEFVISLCNGAAEAALGRKRSDLLGKDLFQVFPKAAGTPLESKLREARSQQRSVSASLEVGDGPRTGSLEVEVQPAGEGLLMLLRPNREPGGAG